jgi:hypothetical protein
MTLQPSQKMTLQWGGKMSFGVVLVFQEYGEHYMLGVVDIGRRENGEGGAVELEGWCLKSGWGGGEMVGDDLGEHVLVVRGCGRVVCD